MMIQTRALPRLTCSGRNHGCLGTGPGGTSPEKGSDSGRSVHQIHSLLLIQPPRLSTLGHPGPFQGPQQPFLPTFLLEAWDSQDGRGDTLHSLPPGLSAGTAPHPQGSLHSRSSQSSFLLGPREERCWRDPRSGAGTPPSPLGPQHSARPAPPPGGGLSGFCRDLFFLSPQHRVLHGPGPATPLCLSERSCPSDTFSLQWLNSVF